MRAGWVVGDENSAIASHTFGDRGHAHHANNMAQALEATDTASLTVRIMHWSTWKR